MSWLDDTLNTIEALDRELEEAFGESRGQRGRPWRRVSFLPGRHARAYPLLNLSEDENAFYVEALAPGVDPASLDITLARNVLTLAGEKPAAKESEHPNSCHRCERAAGKFVRTLSLPKEVQEDKIKAEYKNGLLLLTLPKADIAKPKQIAVEVK